MPIDLDRARDCLRQFDLRKLFVRELGWDNLREAPVVRVEGYQRKLVPLAHKRGFAVFEVPTPAGQPLPDANLRQRIEREVARLHFEHLLVFTDSARTAQVWQWAKREAGRPPSWRAHTWTVAQQGDALLQKLERLAIALHEEPELTLPDVAGKVAGALDVDRVTKKFYERFKAEHQAFLGFIRGIVAQGDAAWYASLMLNRLMFVYFIQRKGFLDGDVHYLRNKLRQMQLARGRDKFLNFYRHFLLRLFHEGLGADRRSDELDALLGKVPFLNGGLFDIHRLEGGAAGQAIAIKDEAFEKLFQFFDAYQWHLDERPLRAENEINPDVLGYIFEKYINQKQMGAYYTKEDITEYIGKNTIVPWLLDAAEKKCAIAFRPDGALWRLLRENPDRYLYPAVRRGVIDDGGEVIPLPAEIAAGLDDVSNRGGWNKPAAAPFALPTETWREHVARRTRCLQLREKLANGEIHAAHDLITWNLDVRQFAQDAIAGCEGPDLLWAFWTALRGASVLDPTCGSGAFLFAALNILEPLYEACLERMQALVDDRDRAGKKTEGKTFAEFRKTLAAVETHANRRYYILKSIVVANLYGVDIMEEAVEICKLRLFLKLVAQLERADQIEPLPDIDFNIRAGNTLVGYTSIEAVRESHRARFPGLPLPDEITKLEAQARSFAENYAVFCGRQTNGGASSSADLAAAKEVLRRLQSDLSGRLDRYLAGDYGIDADDPKKAAAYKKWRESHQPFHWATEFYGIVERGGFDVIIGNPPYVNANKVRKDYMVRHLLTAACPDIYAWCLERCTQLLHSMGRVGMIVPMSLGFSSDFDTLRAVLVSAYPHNWYSSFGRIPTALFSYEVRVRNIVHIGARSGTTHSSYTTILHRWFEVARPHLFQAIKYAEFHPAVWNFRIPKFNSTRLANAFESCLSENKRRVAHLLSASKTVKNVLYFKKTAYNWLAFSSSPPPCFDLENIPVPQTQLDTLIPRDQRAEQSLFLLLNGKLAFVYWCVLGDDFHVTKGIVTEFPIDATEFQSINTTDMAVYCNDLKAAMDAALQYKLNAGKKLGNYNVGACRHVTDRSDRLFADALCLSDVWDDIETYYAQVVRTDFSGEDDA